MNYPAAFTDFFKSPKWMMNLLLAGLCCLVPVLGWIVVAGWLVIGFWGREDEKFETFPDFDFNHIGKYLEKGLWPFLVALVVGVGGSVAVEIVNGILALIGRILVGYGTYQAGMLASGFGFMLMILKLVLKVALMFITIPLVLRATLTQDFVKAFDVPFVKKFVSLAWLETLIVAIVITVAAFVLIPVGLILICIGVGFSIAFLSFISAHLNKQLYKVYLSRGGEAVPVSPKLTDSVPPIPPAPPAAV